MKHLDISYGSSIEDNDVWQERFGIPHKPNSTMILNWRRHTPGDSKRLGRCVVLAPYGMYNGIFVFAACFIGLSAFTMWSATGQLDPGLLDTVQMSSIVLLSIICAIAPAATRLYYQKVAQCFKEDVQLARHLVSDSFVRSLCRGDREAAWSELENCYYAGNVLVTIMCMYALRTSHAVHSSNRELVAEYACAKQTVRSRTEMVREIAERFGFCLEPVGVAIRRTAENVEYNAVTL